MPVYHVRRATQVPPVGRWDDPVWQKAEIVKIDHFYDRSSDHRPVVRARLLWDAKGLHVLYDVKDRYVIGVYTQPQGAVCRDSCVEFFLEPLPNRGYFNFEVNCCGVPLVYYIEDATRVGRVFAKYTPLTTDDLQQVQMTTSLGRMVKPEVTEPVDWWLQVFVPWSLLEKYTGPFTPVAGKSWRGNFFKCADESSRPHWASWAVIEETPLSFHKPQYFGEIRFE